MLEKLTEYGMIEYNPNILVITHYDGQKVDNYYFCKNNLTRFKKRKSVFEPQTPKLPCK